MRSIKFVKEIYGNLDNMKDDSFYIKDFDIAYENKNTLNTLEDIIHFELPFIGRQISNDNKYERSLEVYFNNNIEFNATRCAVIYNDEDCDDFITTSVLEALWKNMDLPEAVKPEKYDEDFWYYDLKFEIGNCILYTEDGDFDTCSIEKSGEKTIKTVHKKTIAVLPYKVSFVKRDFLTAPEESIVPEENGEPVGE